MHRPVLVTPPAELPVSLAEDKEQLRVTHAEQDAMILRHVNAAVSHLDGYRGILGRCLVTQTWAQLADAWDRFRLPFPDVSSVAISYRDTAGNTVVVPTSDYRLVHWHPSLMIDYGSAWAAPALHANGYAAITLTMTCGYGAAADVPAEIKDAILIHVQARYDGTPRDVWKPAHDDLIDKYRVKRV